MTASSNGTALITGASSGIGADYADRLARRGFDLILVARSSEKLAAFASKLRRATGRGVTAVTADLGDREDLRRVEGILRDNASITMLVNNAGFGGVAPLLQSNIDRMEAMIDLNVTALTRLTYAAVPGLVARGGGTIINISSIVAVAPEILNGVYGGTKAFVLAFSQSLHHELAGQGIRVQAVLPGGTATDFWQTAGHGDFTNSVNAMPSGIMVDAALAGLDKGEAVTLPSLPDGTLWDAYEALRRQISGDLAHARPGKRYLPRAVRAAL